MFVNESISSGQTTAAQVVASLMASEDTCRNLMNATATGLGAGYAESDSNLSPFWSIVLGAE